jgi:YidC/Oxa1 family membrane protein insertase
MQQKRFFLALIISAAILFGWNYFFPIKPATQNNANSANANTSAATQPTASAPTPSPQSTVATNSTTPAINDASAQSNQNGTPNRKLKVKTPLYEVVLDNHGAIASSWVITKIKKNDKEPARDIYSVAGTKENRHPLELLPPEQVRRGIGPFLLTSSDSNINATLGTSNYEVGEIRCGSGDVVDLTTAGCAEQRIDFVLKGLNGATLTKSITFYADRYITNLEIKMTPEAEANAQAGADVSRAIPDLKLLIGPSIGDQGIAHYSFYSVAPEGVVSVGGKVQRLYAATINSNKESPDKHLVSGPIEWAAVGDTYFAMAAVPQTPVQLVEYRTTQYDYQANGKKESRYLISAYLPVPASDTRMLVYVGPKDHDLLQAASAVIKQNGGPPVDLEGLIDYGRLAFISRPLAVPILVSIHWLQKITGSYGVAIILFTILIYSLFFPLKWRSSKAMKKAQKLAPRMKELQEKIKGLKQNDPKLKELQMEQLRLMREGNPLGGCLPLLIQMPFLFALYCAITISIDFRQASFLWIPDLSAAEPTFIHILPIMMAGSLMVLQLITPAPSADPLQRKMMAIGMPIFMLWVMWSAPAGLLVYWLVGNIVGFAQQFIINRLTKSEDDEEPPGEKKLETRSTKKLNPTPVSGVAVPKRS